VHRRLDSLVRIGKESTRTRKIELMYDAIIAMHAIEITCSKWITRTVKLCSQYDYACSCFELL
jgi:hypothetical protein